MAFFVSAVVTAVDLGTFAAVATAVSEVGTAISVVGAITGNSSMTKVGGIMGLAGGVAGLASGAFSGAADAASNAADGSGAINSAATNLGQSTSEIGGDIAQQGADDASSLSLSIPSNTPSGDILDTASAQSGTPYGTGAGINGAPSGTGGSNGIIGSQMQNSAQAPTLSNAAGTDAGATTAPTADANAATAPPATTAAPATPAINSPSPATAPTVANQVNNLTSSQMAGSSANLAGVDPNSVKPAAGISNDILDTPSAQSGTPYGTGAGINGAPSGTGGSNGGIFSGLTNWINQNPKAAQLYGQIGATALTGLGQAYQAGKANEIAQGQLAINQQRQNNANSQTETAPTGIINSARKKANGAA